MRARRCWRAAIRVQHAARAAWPGRSRTCTVGSWAARCASAARAWRRGNCGAWPRQVAWSSGPCRGDAGSSTVEDEILFRPEKLGWPWDEMEHRLTAGVERFGLLEMRLRSPHTPSGGEQQKLALAAITARRPQALVLDEPLSMLDTTAALEFVAHTRGAARAGDGGGVLRASPGIPAPPAGFETMSLGKSRTIARRRRGSRLAGAGGSPASAARIWLERAAGRACRDPGFRSDPAGRQADHAGRARRRRQDHLLRALSGLQPYTAASGCR